MTLFPRKVLALAVLGLGLTHISSGQTLLTSVQWNPPAANPVVSGSGTWFTGNTVNLITSAVINAGAVFNWDWSAAPFRSGFSLSTTNNSGIAIGVGAGTTATQTLTFSSVINSPYLWFNFIDPSTSFNFGAYNWTFLSGNKASRSGSSVISTGLNASDDGFLIRINQDFGPGTSLNFNYVSTGVASTSGFTISTVPEPSAFSLLAIGLGVVLRRRRRTV
jgi:hypothetical protein